MSKKEKQEPHAKKLYDTQEFLIDILKLANEYACSNENENKIITDITKRTEQFVKKHQDPRIYHYVLNFLLIIIPPFLIFKLARQCIYNENMFYNADNDLTRAAKTISDEIIPAKNNQSL